MHKHTSNNFNECIQILKLHPITLIGVILQTPAHSSTLGKYPQILRGQRKEFRYLKTFSHELAHPSLLRIQALPLKQQHLSHPRQKRGGAQPQTDYPSAKWK